MKRILIASLLLSIPMAVAGFDSATAKKSTCTADEVEIPDDRPGGGVLCISKMEWKKAAKICKKNGSDNPMECVCQDGDSVGACGD